VTSDPQIIPRDALTGARVALSVSESADLRRLGLAPAHLRQTIAELTRAIVIAGGTVVYGGRIDQGFTSIVLEQSERFARHGVSFEHVVPFSEHVDIDPAALRAYEASLGVHTSVTYLDAEGRETTLSELRSNAGSRPEPAESLTRLRQTLADKCDARVIAAGRLSGYLGTMPGVVEEAMLTVERHKPLYIAGGFGGAAAFVGMTLAPELYAWLPADMPEGASGVPNPVIDALSAPAVPVGLSAAEGAALAATNRPSDVATLTVLGMSRLRS